MSSCWRCEKDLPVGQVECDPPCDEAPSGAATIDQVVKDAIENDTPVILHFTIIPDRKKIQTPGETMMFNKAMREFMIGMARSFSTSGLNSFCKPMNPPPQED